MDNPYWYTKGRSHYIDLGSVKRLCFWLLNIFAASQTLSREFELAEIEEGKCLALAASPLLALYRELAEPQISRLLLQLALMVRTYDDLMINSRVADDYSAHAKTTAGENYIGNLSDGDLDLREACNKIIHAAEIRPLYQRIDREVVRQGAEGELDQDIWYLTGEIELNGTNRRKPWNATLHVQSFIEIVLDRIAFGQNDVAGD